MTSSGRLRVSLGMTTALLVGGPVFGANAHLERVLRAHATALVSVSAIGLYDAPGEPRAGSSELRQRDSSS